MATISQIKIGNQTYDICDTDNRQTIETINDTLTTINQDLTAIQNRFDSNGVLKVANGGTAQGSFNNALLHALGVAKTAGETVDISNFRGAGFVTNGRKDFAFTVCTRYLFYGVSAKNSYITGTYTVRQNNNTHFGGANYSFSNNHFMTEITVNGHVNIVIRTGSEQTGMTNNDTAGVVLGDNTILNLRS